MTCLDSVRSDARLGRKCQACACVRTRNQRSPFTCMPPYGAGALFTMSCSEMQPIWLSGHSPLPWCASLCWPLTITAGALRGNTTQLVSSSQANGVRASWKAQALRPELNTDPLASFPCPARPQCSWPCGRSVHSRLSLQIPPTGTTSALSNLVQGRFRSRLQKRPGGLLKETSFPQNTVASRFLCLNS